MSELTYLAAWRRAFGGLAHDLIQRGANGKQILAACHAAEAAESPQECQAADDLLASESEAMERRPLLLSTMAKPMPATGGLDRLAWILEQQAAERELAELED